MRVVFYCPDRHILYNGETPDSSGIGGGITARIRMAAALAALGDDVEVYANCSEAGTYDGVRWFSLDHKPEGRADVLIVHSSGGALDVSSAATLPVDAKFRILFVSGFARLAGAEAIRWDVIYPPSEFIADVIRREWQMPEVPIFVAPYGVRRFTAVDESVRDPHRLIYTSHPSKGFESAIAVVRLLRERDSKFVLHVYGGDRLWGQAERDLSGEPGVVYHGMVGQEELWSAYLASGFALHLQDRLEPFGICLVESMAAGCIAIASPVGAYVELIRDGETGLHVAGYHGDPATRVQAANLILACLGDPRRAQAIRNAAAHAPLEWSQVAERWHAHWQGVL
jgi:glycosyltransferase involved in cell wall biosynthesis